MPRLLGVALLVVLSLAAGAPAQDASWPKELTFALLSTESAQEITRRWQPILTQLEKDLGIKVKSTVATDYRGTIEALRFKKAEIGWLGPKAYVEATNNNYANVDAIAQVRNENGSLGYRACLVVHSESDIFSPEDIGGKTFAFNDPNSTSGYLVPMTFFLNELTIDPKKHFAKVTFSGSHEASILAVAGKKVEVASTNVPDLQQLTREGKVPRGSLRVIWVSKLIPLDPVVVRKDLPPSLRAAITDSLIGMKERAPDAFVNAGSYFKGGFVPADDAKYQVIREMNDAARRLAAQK
jgi:phosphonate transport system substrate-binding protein